MHAKSFNMHKYQCTQILNLLSPGLAVSHFGKKGTWFMCGQYVQYGLKQAFKVFRNLFHRVFIEVNIICLIVFDFCIEGEFLW